MYSAVPEPVHYSFRGRLDPGCSRGRHPQCGAMSNLPNGGCDINIRERCSAQFGQADKWNFCLTAARMLRIRSKYVSQKMMPVTIEISCPRGAGRGGYQWARTLFVSMTAM